ncbi:hypothetical protein GCM10023194_21570 [Planotetraspora phitsanulokensis]|uniref:Uncharacterized protein n=1 Tax=Planotetraspora phitsanulokensis TaxID=575192 RepID=A0A8J3U4S5_9ACTN|nr:hypothetical protein Pph01_32180 [Planotetraspora phitsanulokensis]
MKNGQYMSGTLAMPSRDGATQFASRRVVRRAWPTPGPVVLETGRDIIRLSGVSGGSVFVVHPDRDPPDG